MNQLLDTMNLLSYEALARDLELAIISGKLRAGERIPSLRKLAESRGVSVYTVQQALNVLCSKGLAEVHPQQGFFVRQERNGHSGPVITIIHHRVSDHRKDPHGIACTTMALRGISQEAAKADAVLKKHYEIPPSIPQAALEAILAEDDADAAIILGCFDEHPREWTTTIPLAGVWMDHLYSGLLSPVNVDAVQKASFAVRFFRERGVRELWASYLVPGSEFDFLLRGMWQGPIREMTLAQQETAPDFPPGSGCLFHEGALANSVARLYRQLHGRPMIADLPVLTLDNKRLLNPDFEPMNFLDADWDLGGRLAFREVMRRIQEPGPGVRIRLNCTMDTSDSQPFELAKSSGKEKKEP